MTGSTQFAARYAAPYPAAMKMPARRPGGADRLPAVPRRAPPADPALQLHRADLRRDPPPRQGHRPAPRRDQLPHPGLGRPGPGLPRLARPDHDQRRRSGCCRTCAAPCSTRPASCGHAPHRQTTPATTVRRMSEPPPNITMKPEPRPSDLHRIPDATGPASGVPTSLWSCGEVASRGRPAGQQETSGERTVGVGA